MFVNFNSETFLYNETRGEVRNSKYRSPELLSKNSLKEFLESKFDWGIKGKGKINTSEFAIAFDLFLTFEDYIQKIELVNTKFSWKGLYVFKHHFFSKKLIKLNNNWRSEFTIINDGNMKFIKDIKAPILSKENLYNLVIRNKSYIKKGQSVQNNQWYYDSTISTHCLPLQELVVGGNYHKTIFVFDQKNLVFNYHYSNDYTIGGSGWSRTDYYEGIINCKDWSSEENLIESIKDKWD